ncbi:MAG TPA: hypothetical protein VFG04_14140 [Planctomycetaceae bacterium]|jgi:hypothetical protein|nr:hypothetical protein [Planctomycetaceae bacterium]
MAKAQTAIYGVRVDAKDSARIKIIADQLWPLSLEAKSAYAPKLTEERAKQLAVHVAEDLVKLYRTEMIEPDTIR